MCQSYSKQLHFILPNHLLNQKKQEARSKIRSIRVREPFSFPLKQRLPAPDNWQLTRKFYPVARKVESERPAQTERETRWKNMPRVECYRSAFPKAAFPTHRSPSLSPRKMLQRLLSSDLSLRFFYFNSVIEKQSSIVVGDA